MMGKDWIYAVVDLEEKSEELNIPKESIEVIIAAFSIPSILMAPIIGILSGRFGRKKYEVSTIISRFWSNSN